MHSFLKYGAVSAAVQILVWLIIGGAAMLLSPRIDALVEKYLYLYYPTITLVARYGNFTGDANIVRPILIGVPLGILFYSVVFATVVSIAHFKK